MGGLGGVQSHIWQGSTYYESEMLTTAPQQLNISSRSLARLIYPNPCSYSPSHLDMQTTNIQILALVCILFIIIVWSPCSKQMSFVLLWAVGNQPHCCNFRQSYCRFFPTMLPVTYWAKLQHFYLVVFHPTKADFRFRVHPYNIVTILFYHKFLYLYDLALKDFAMTFNSFLRFLCLLNSLNLPHTSHNVHNTAGYNNITIKKLAEK